MKFLRFGWMVWMAVCPLAAGTIMDVSTHASQQMNPGDTLYFLVSNLSLHTSVDTVEFQFVTLPIDPSAQVEAELTSRDGTVSIAFASLQIAGGTFTGSAYQGAISAISGNLQLPATVSQEIFQNTRATLVLHDLGPAVALGLPGYNLRQDLMMSLTSGTTSAGAFTSAALYEDPPPPPVGAPESDPAVLVVAAGGMMCLASHLLKRISHHGI
jgi:hypothetical protein